MFDLLHFGETIIAAAFVAGGVYVGVRIDLKYMKEKIEDVKESTKDAHERLDVHIEKFHSR